MKKVLFIISFALSIVAMIVAGIECATYSLLVGIGAIMVADNKRR